MPLPTPNWTLPEPVPAALARDLGCQWGVPPLLAALLHRRGFTSREKVDAFLNPKLRGLADPFELPDMEAAAGRLLSAVECGERITLYGDYDVDGVTSLAVLCEAVQALGGEVATFLPHRIDEGYGITPQGLERCIAETRPGLLVAVDCGTSSKAALDGLVSRGIDAIVLDHHEAVGDLPACPVVNPKRGTRSQYLCSAGIAFKVCHALQKLSSSNAFDLAGLLDLVALGTVSDLVPLEAENRILVRHGLCRLAGTKREGLLALMRVSGIQGRVDAGQIGFALGPRLNAAGRLDSASAALELLISKDSVRAESLARTLNEHNLQRRAIERRTFEEAVEQTGREFAAGRSSAIVVGSDSWHAGVVGIVASRLMRKFHRPAVVVAFDAAGSGKGSARSVPGFDLVRALGQCAEFLERFGGHEMAAGLSLQRNRFEEFACALECIARTRLTPDDLAPRLELDATLPVERIQSSLRSELDRLEPFGMGNRQPLFFAPSATPSATPRILKEKHLRVQFSSGEGPVSAIFFNGASDLLPPPPWDIAYHLERNSFRGTESLQMQIRAIRPA